MSDFWTNPWVTGIGGGVISSLIVFFATKYFFNKKENKEYAQKVRLANNDILHAIRPLIIDHKLPLRESFTSLRIAISNKYGVKADDLYSNKSLANDLIAEILGNPFLTTDQKNDFCRLILQFKYDEEVDLHEIVYLNKKLQFSSRFTSMVLAFSSFAMILSMTLLIAKETKGYEPSEWEKQLFGDNLALFLTATLIPLAGIIVYYFGIKVRTVLKHDFENKNEEDDEAQ